MKVFCLWKFAVLVHLVYLQQAAVFTTDYLFETTEQLKCSEQPAGENSVTVAAKASKSRFKCEKFSEATQAFV